MVLDGLTVATPVAALLWCAASPMCKQSPRQQARLRVLPVLPNSALHLTGRGAGRPARAVLEGEGLARAGRLLLDGPQVSAGR